MSVGERNDKIVGEHLGRLRCERKDFIKKVLKETVMKVRQIHVTEVRVWCLVFVNVLRNL
jgi:hypothetical protein